MARSALMTGWAHLQLACPLFGHMLCAASWQISPSRLNVPCLHCRLTHPLPAAGPNKGRLQTREQPPIGTHQGLCSRAIPFPGPGCCRAPLSLP